MRLFGIFALMLIVASAAYGDVAASEQKFRVAEAKITAEYREKLLAATETLAADLAKDRENAMKAGNLDAANSADKALKKANSEIDEMKKGLVALPLPSAPKIGKVLLVFSDHSERDSAVEYCKTYGLDYDTVASFDMTQTDDSPFSIKLDMSHADYRPYQTIVAGSNDMVPWHAALAVTPDAFKKVDRFISDGGHLIAFGSWNGEGTSALNPYGIQCNYAFSWNFAPSPFFTDVLVKGNEDLVPKNHGLTCTSNIICTVPHDSLLLRADDQGVPATMKSGSYEAMITLRHDKGRITYCSVEPNYVDHGNNGLWLLKSTLCWVSRGCPDPFTGFGGGGAKDDGEAAKWLRKAADAADEDAMDTLGFAYEIGRGVPKNSVDAVRWYRKAAAAGSDDAKKNLQRLGEKP